MQDRSPLSLNEVDFAPLTKQLRKLRRLTQEQLARELDVTFGTVNAWENGRHEPIAALGRRLVELAEAAGIGALPQKSTRSSIAPTTAPVRSGRKRS
jgi:transcriptional regulator with XRE-family HTH domain